MPKMQFKKLYKMSSGKRRCSECKYDFIPHKLPMRLTRVEWKQIIHFFLMEQNSNSIIERTRFEWCRVFRELTKIRIVLVKDVPEIFSGTVELMKRMSEDNGKINENRFVITVQNEDGGPRNNRYLESFVGAAKSGQKSLMTLKLTRFNHWSQEKYHWDLSSVLYLESLYRNCRKRICSSSRRSWWKTAQWRKRKSDQWSGGVLGVS